MKSLIAAIIIITSQIAFATSNSCKFTMPPGRTEVQVLQMGQFVELAPNQIQTVYSCGAFINDGSVVVGPATQVVELASGECGTTTYPGLNYIIYCK